MDLLRRLGRRRQLLTVVAVREAAPATSARGNTRLKARAGIKSVALINCETQLAELAAAIAWENHHGRLNQALGIRPAGFSDSAFCAVPEK